MAVKLTDLRLIYGVAGAREKFEDLTVQLIRSERPDAERVRIVRGDGGIDAHDGSITDPSGVDVFQVKFFPDGVGEAQKKQIRDSFSTARDSTKFRTRSWTMCLPIDLSLDEKTWFDTWKGNQSGTGIDILPVWGATKLEGLLYEQKNRGVKEAFFKEEHLELLRVQGANIEKLVHEFVQRIPMPAPPVLQMTLEAVKPREAYRWQDDKMVLEVQFCYRLRNVGKKAVPKWGTGANLSLSDDSLGKRFVNKDEFPRLGSGNSYYRPDSTILPSLTMTTEQLIGVIVRRSEQFDELLPKILNATTLTFWPVTEDGPGLETVVRLADVIDWAAQLPGFQQSHMLALGRLDAK
jgi:hypothetical protein